MSIPHRLTDEDAVKALSAAAASTAAASPGDIARAQAAAAALPDPVPAGEPYDRTIGALKGVAAFIAKTYAMVSDSVCDHIITWLPEGTSFIVVDADGLTDSVLGTFFKHSNFQSFIRQLNMYGFRKVGAPSHWEFYHDGFRRGRTSLLRYIKRRRKGAAAAASAKASASATAPAPPPAFQRELKGLKRQRDELQHELVSLASAQEAMDTQLAAIAAENARLRDELAASHRAHQAMVDTVSSIVSLLGDKAAPASATLRAALPPLPLDFDDADLRPAKRARGLESAALAPASSLGTPTLAPAALDLPLPAAPAPSRARPSLDIDAALATPVGPGLDIALRSPLFGLTPSAGLMPMGLSPLAASGTSAAADFSAFLSDMLALPPAV
ncbi:heat stress transcription factor A-4c [Thecamonas trahens ATCC 50062]|uniref:Heat stress transcription factor A-4c n=1 Tax=Thecamonas trahens ATCC 50062 TaxID=461836 RepID=A0A0L0D7S7_THETB|nr:heat stress transcription factor A-4c [Thecamonas trahens ATCC 50062]KNC48111.1 heat stress transcription factor A-4c [Thecamonas trahens ATCC 50062]|eukprot:XP_013758684.1 heat stress transcription factor A-4c [Thecamonas trahens ATCC 50062]